MPLRGQTTPASVVLVVTVVVVVVLDVVVLDVVVLDVVVLDVVVVVVFFGGSSPLAVIRPARISPPTKRPSRRAASASRTSASGAQTTPASRARRATVIRP